MNDTTYIVISPVRNEAQFLPQTVSSMKSQTCLPLKWVIVNDGSTDNTAALVRDASRQSSWIESVERRDRGFRQPGVGVVDAFYDGFQRVEKLGWRYVVKMDGDLRLPEDYFERLIAAFERDSRLGICSGDIFNQTDHGLVLDSPTDPEFHVRGAAKMYRRECWTDIGGIQHVTGFDSIDNIAARMRNWNTRRIHDLPVIHLRKTGAAGGTWRNAYKNGIGANAIGYHPAFLLAKCIKRTAHGCPLDALGQFCGYVAGYFARIPRVRDKDLVSYLRHQQWNRLIGKQSIWH